MMTRPGARMLRAIDEELRALRAARLDTPPGDPRRAAIAERTDRLLDRRAALTRSGRAR